MPSLNGAVAAYPDEWTPEHWAGRARMAAARRHAGIELDPVDRQALARYPDPPPSCTPR